MVYYYSFVNLATYCNCMAVNTHLILLMLETKIEKKNNNIEGRYERVQCTIVNVLHMPHSRN